VIGAYWTLNEMDLLRELWARSASDEEIRRALPNHTLSASLVKARAMRLGRRFGVDRRGGLRVRAPEPRPEQDECPTPGDQLSVGCDKLLARLREVHPELAP
jgi:hypothetical protein